MPFYYTPYVLLPLLSAILNGSLAVYARRHRNIPAASWLSWLLCGLSLWSLSYGLNIAAAGLPLKNLFFKLGSSGFALVLYASIPLTLVILGKERWLTRLLLLLLALEPLSLVLLTWTNDLHGMVRHTLHLVERPGLLLQSYVDGPYYAQFHIRYVYLYFLTMIALCVWGILQRRQVRRLSFVFVALATLAPLIVDMLNISPVKELRFTTSVNWFSGICYCLAVFRGRILELVPIARNALFEQMQEPVLVIDQEHRLAEYNHSAFACLSLPDKAIGQSISVLFPAGHALHSMDNCEQNETRYDAEHNRYWQISRSNLNHEQVQIGQVLVLHDITALSHAQEESRQNARRFQQLAEESADMVWQLDADLYFTYVNAADSKLRGFSAEEVIGTSFLSILYPDDADMFRRNHAERLAGEQQGIRIGTIRHELRMLCNGGSYIWTEIHATSLRNTHEAVTGYICVTRDISRRKSEEQQMVAMLLKEQEIRSEQERFLDMISHEYRTPLAIIQSNIGLMELKRCSHCSITPDPLTKMNRAVERLVDVFESFRRQKCVDQRPHAPELVRIDISAFFNDTLSAASGLWGNRFVFSKESAADGASMLADHRMLRTAVMNLLDNAVKYSEPGSVIRLELYCDLHQATLRIHNTSAAPLQNNLETLFKKFQRGGNSAGTSGTGVGLYLARDLVEQSGGRLTLTVEEHCEITATMTLPVEIASP